jgi:hypothetical protein
MRSKAYCKGAHLRQLQSKGRAGHLVEGDLSVLDRVLRLELELGRDWWAGKQYFEVSDGLENEAVEYWAGLFGQLEGVEMPGTELGIIEKVAPNRRLAIAAYRTLQLVRSQGREAAQLSVSRATWFRHQALLRKAGVGEADLHGLAQVIRFPVRQLVACRVDSWDDLRRAA